jgi:multiple sugar transport system permease protein
VPPAPPTVSRRRRRVRCDGRALSTLVMALPMLLVFTLFAWWPLLRAGVLSVQRSNLVDAPAFVGLDNFRAVLADPLLWTAVKNTVWFVFLALVFGFPIPLVLAVMMSELRRNRGLYSALAYLPVVIPPVASILLWRVFFDASPTGTFNTILGWFGLGPWPWIQDPTWAMPSIVLLATWSNAGATVIIYLAALTSVRAELYEAAEVDGASLPRKIWHVTLPQLRTVLFVTLMLQIVGTFQVFTEPFLLTSGGPADSTVSILLLIYRYGFGSGGGVNYGEATALSIMLAAFLAVFTAAYFWATRAWSDR